LFYETALRTQQWTLAPISAIVKVDHLDYMLRVDQLRDPVRSTFSSESRLAAYFFVRKRSFQVPILLERGFASRAEAQKT
jgi:hypothetical protein